jgi:hypothetical protein
LIELKFLTIIIVKIKKNNKSEKKMNHNKSSSRPKNKQEMLKLLLSISLLTAVNSVGEIFRVYQEPPLQATIASKPFEILVGSGNHERYTYGMWIKLDAGTLVDDQEYLVYGFSQISSTIDYYDFEVFFKSLSGQIKFYYDVTHTRNNGTVLPRGFINL